MKAFSEDLSRQTLPPEDKSLPLSQTGKIKIRRVERRHKKSSAKEKILAGFGLASTVMGGGLGSMAAKQPKSRIVASQKTQNTSGSKISRQLTEMFGIPTAAAASGNGIYLINNSAGRVIGVGGYIDTFGRFIGVSISNGAATGVLEQNGSPSSLTLQEVKDAKPGWVEEVLQDAATNNVENPPAASAPSAPIVTLSLPTYLTNGTFEMDPNSGTGTETASVTSSDGNTAFTVTSSNPSVAHANINGNSFQIIAGSTSGGTATITFKSTADPSKTATINVQIKTPAVAPVVAAPTVTSLSLSKSSMAFANSGGTDTAIATVSMSDQSSYSGRVNVTPGDSSLSAGYSNGTITVTAPANSLTTAKTYTLTVSVPGITQTQTINVTVAAHAAVAASVTDIVIKAMDNFDALGSSKDTGVIISMSDQSIYSGNVSVTSSNPAFFTASYRSVNPSAYTDGTVGLLTVTSRQFTSDPNNPASAVITVSVGGKTQNLNVSQKVNAARIKSTSLKDSYMSFSSQGGTNSTQYTLTMDRGTFNGDVTVTSSDSAVASGYYSNGRVYITAGQNSGSTGKTAHISIAASGERVDSLRDFTDSISVTVAGNSAAAPVVAPSAPVVTLSLPTYLTNGTFEMDPNSGTGTETASVTSSDGNTAFTVTSSNSSVAHANINGNSFQIIAGSTPGGTATITFKSTADPSKTATINVQIKTPAVAPVVAAPTTPISADFDFSHTTLPTGIGTYTTDYYINGVFWFNFMTGSIDKSKDAYSAQQASQVFNTILTKVWSTRPVSLEQAQSFRDSANKTITDLFDKIPWNLASSKTSQWGYVNRYYINSVNGWYDNWSASINSDMKNVHAYQSPDGNRVFGSDIWGSITIDKDGNLLSVENNADNPPPASWLNAIKNATNVTMIGGATATAAITTNSLPNGKQGTAYDQSLSASVPVSWSATGLPSGLSLSAAGQFSGIPGTAGTFTVHVTATPADGSSVSKDFTITIVASAVPVVTPLAVSIDGGINSVQQMSSGSIYVATLRVPGGKDTYTWKFQADDGSAALPAGYIARQNSDGSFLIYSGALNNTTSGNAAYNFTATVTDSKGNSGSQHFRVTVTPAPAVPVITTDSVPKGALGSVYTGVTLKASSAGSWKLLPGGPLLPAGLSLSNTGVISGQPDGVAGTFNFTVAFTDGSTNQTVTKQFSIIISPLDLGPIALAITTSSLPGATVSTAYASPALTATGLGSAVNWTATGLPSTLTMNPTTGAITGTPIAAGTMDITVTAKDAANVTVIKTFSLTIIPAASAANYHIAGVVFGQVSVLPGQSYELTFLTDIPGSITNSYFDVQVKAPDGTVSSVNNWQQGPTGSHTVASDATLGFYQITGYRVHNVQENHSGTFSNIAISNNTGILVADASKTAVISKVSAIPTFNYVMPSGSPSNTIFKGASYWTVVLTGQHLEQIHHWQLPQGSDRTITLTSLGVTKTDSTGNGIEAKFYVSVADDAPAGKNTINLISTNGQVTPVDFNVIVPSNANRAATGTISTVSLPDAKAGTAYIISPLTVTGLGNGLAWTVTGLPEGLSLDRTSGAISGTAAAAGNFNVAVRVTDSAGEFATKTFNMSVDASGTKIVIGGLVFDKVSVLRGGSYKATFQTDKQNNLDNMYFDVKVELVPGGTVTEILNWQQGGTASHSVPNDMAFGFYRIAGYRMHSGQNDHTGNYSNSAVGNATGVAVVDSATTAVVTKVTVTQPGGYALPPGSPSNTILRGANQWIVTLTGTNLQYIHSWQPSAGAGQVIGTMPIGVTPGSNGTEYKFYVSISNNAELGKNTVDAVSTNGQLVPVDFNVVTTLLRP